MKVRLPENYRHIFTLNDLENARAVSKEMQADESTAKEYAAIAAREALRFSRDYLREVLTATATTERNCNAWDALCPGSENMDVWIDATVRTWSGFVVIGAYLTDIWSIDGETDIASRMFIRYFTEAPLTSRD